jgi:hypothetical protein
MMGGGTHTLEGHVAWNLKDNDRGKHELVAQVDGCLVHINVLGETGRQCACQVHAVELEYEESQHQQEENRKVNPNLV